MPDFDALNIYNFRKRCEKRRNCLLHVFYPIWNLFFHFKFCLKCHLQFVSIWTSLKWVNRLPFGAHSNYRWKRELNALPDSLHMVSHHCFFATLNKERNSSYLQLSRRLNGKMLVLEFLYSRSTPILQQKKKKKEMRKKPTCQTIAFFAKY